ncbi:MAG: thiamine pyrophosphate-dependent dehydrogenase E1 component subunit alpha [Eubacteriales bacterium]
MEMSRETAAEILYKLYSARIFEEHVNEMFMRGMIHGTTHLSIGQEGVAVGAIYALGRDDLIMSSHRGHSHCIAKDADIKRMMCELLGKEPGFCKGMGGSMHIVDIQSNNYGANGIVGPAIGIATGIALALKKEKGNRVIANFFGDGTSNAGIFHEALNMAALWKLPIVYICENNLYGMSTSVAKTVSVPNVADRASAYGIPGVIVDGNDVFAMMDVVGQAVERARRGEGPTLVEAKTYRWLGHSKSDKRAYRTKEEEEAWKAKCPIKRFEQYMLKNGFTEEEMMGIRKQAADAIEEAAEYAISAPVLSIEEAKKLIYA